VKPRLARGFQHDDYPDPEDAMSDDKMNRGAPDRDRIDINDPDEVRNWTKSLGVSKEELQKAVEAAGTNASKVREFLSRGR
jgi:hypothetical protein